MSAGAKDILGLAGLFLVLFLSCMDPFPGNRVQPKALETWCRQKMQELVTAVKEYELDQGKPPADFEDLIPTYYDVPENLYVKSPYTNTSKPDDRIAANPDVIKAYSAYLLIPLKGKDFVISERPGMWKDRMLGFVLTSENEEHGFKSVYCRVSEDDFQKLLADKFAAPIAGASPVRD